MVPGEVCVQQMAAYFPLLAWRLWRDAVASLFFFAASAYKALALAQEGRDIDDITGWCITITARQAKSLLIKAANRPLGMLVTGRTL